MPEQEVSKDSNGQDCPEHENNTDEETELDSKIIRQVEFYFGDVNLPRDKFLREQVKLDEGWVPLDVLIRFNRLAKLSTDTEVIANSLNKSSSGLLEVSEDNKKVRRNPELPVPEMNEERRKELMSRTVYVKGFPKDVLLDDILKFLKDYEEVENVIMRRYLEQSTKKRLFKGSIFVTFKTKEQADKFINTKDLKYGETDLILRWQEAYIHEKQEEFAARKDKKDKKNKNTEEKQKEAKEELKLPTGTLIHFSECEEKLKREDIKEALTALGAEVSYIDFNSGDKEGTVRLSKENSAKEVMEKATDNKIKIGESEVTIRLLEGDEEQAYLEKTVEEMVKRRKNQKTNRYNNKGKNFKGKQGGRKRRQDKHGDAPPNKVKANAS